MILNVVSSVTSVTPSTGSRYGGTLLTIAGTNFGTVKTDNPVKIATNGGAGAIDCFVQTIVPTQITCRIDENMKTKDAGTTAEVAVMLKTSEEAQCTSPVCNWSYVEPTPTITADGMTKEFDPDSNPPAWKIKIAGTGLRDSAASGAMSDLQINGVSQTVLSHTDTLAIFTVTNVPNLTLKNLAWNLFFPAGLP